MAQLWKPVFAARVMSGLSRTAASRSEERGIRAYRRHQWVLGPGQFPGTDGQTGVTEELRWTSSGGSINRRCQKALANQLHRVEGTTDFQRFRAIIGGSRVGASSLNRSRYLR